MTLLDQQHQQIISIINELIESCQATVRSEVISEALSRLTRYARVHFKTEEGLLKKYGYPDLDEQIEEHHAYCLKVIALCEDTMINQDAVPQDTLQFILDWWRGHILVSDMKYRPFLTERGVV